MNDNSGKRGSPTGSIHFLDNVQIKCTLYKGELGLELEKVRNFHLLEERDEFMSQDLREEGKGHCRGHSGQRSARKTEIIGFHKDLPLDLINVLHN